MIRNTYKVVKAEVSASCKYYTSFYELRVCFEDTDKESRGEFYNVGMYEMKNAAGVKKGDGFKKIQAFLDTEEGKQWLGKTLYERDLRNATDKIETTIRACMRGMDLEKLMILEQHAKELIKS